MPEDKDPVSQLLDLALSSYVPEHEPLGLDWRVANRIRESVMQRRRRRWLAYVVAGLATACCAILAPVLRQDLQIVQRPPQVRVASRAITPKEANNRVPDFRSAAPSPAVIHTLRSRQQRRFRKTPLPKLDQFPAPEPLSDQERGLLALSRRNKGSRSMASSGDIDPIHIKPLEIQPL